MSRSNKASSSFKETSMATAYQNLSEYDFNSVPDASEMNIGIVVKRVPGSFELTFGAKRLAETKELDAVIVLGCVVRGDTPHFDYVCSGVTQGITELNLMYDIPFIFGLLTTDTMQQSEDRAGGRYGNKGDEAAVTAIKMVNFSA